MVRSLVAVAIAGCIACQGQDSRSAGPASGAPVSAGSDASPPEPAIPDDAGLVTGDPDPRDARAKPEEPEVPDPSRVIAELGAVPAWQAVVDRAQLLGRRGQHGVVYGVVGPALMIPAHDLEEPQPPEPSHAIAGGSLPAGARTISVARDNDAVYFQIVGPAPASDGDGWQIADQLGSPVVAVINLPGERATYGGQDMRAADERWQLKRGQVYWVRIGKLRKRGPDKPTTVNARTAPVRVL